MNAILHDLLGRIETAAGPDRHLDAEIEHVLTGRTVTVSNAMLLTAKLDAVYDLLEEVFPDFVITSGLCSLSGHATIMPDYNGPRGQQLKVEWNEDRFHEGWSADLLPGDGRHRECLAILSCIVQAALSRNMVAAQKCLVEQAKLNGQWYRHKKRGSVYALVGTAEFSEQLSNETPGHSIADDDELAILKSENGHFIVNLAGEVPADGTWQFICWGRVQISSCPKGQSTRFKNGTMFTIYSGDDGTVWLRPEAEFHDGRFEAVVRP